MTLSPAATEKYLAIMSKQTEAEVNADCEPSGAIIQVTFDHIFFIGRFNHRLWLH